MKALDDSEYLKAWQEPEGDAVKTPKAPQESGFMDKLGVLGKSLLTNNTPRTSTAGTVR
jgi:hypothetical protein